ncbi:hypothetical protein [Thiobaca trueperi]|nr:hypothetical protein [Thiobaca trueperi]
MGRAAYQSCGAIRYRYCARGLGYADPDAPENRLRTPRAPLDEWVRFVS